MAMVLPNGILGNPGEQMEAVRWWIMRNMELLASVDLPGEAFLPQISIQASCVFLRRRDENELDPGWRTPDPVGREHHRNVVRERAGWRDDLKLRPGAELGT